MNRPKGHLPALTGVRGIAALLIVVYHMYGEVKKAGATPLPGLRFGWIGVDLFFVLSGFVLAWVLWSRSTDVGGKGFWGSYATQRTLRIIPTYYAALLATMVMLGTLSVIVDRPGAFLLHLLLLQTFDPNSFAAVNPLFWTLAVELHFYLILPFLLPLFSRRLWPYALGGALLVTLLWRWFLYTPETALFLFYMPAFLFHFAIGVVVARFVIEGWRAPAPMVTAAAGMALFVLLPLVTLIPANNGLQALSSAEANLLVRPLVAAGFALMIWSLCAPGLGSTLLSWRPFVLSGHWSYSIYLIHIPLLILLREVPGLRDGPQLAYFAVGLTVSVIGGYLLYRLVEDPMNRFRNRLRNKDGKASPEQPPDRPIRMPIPVASPESADRKGVTQ